jgi:predicted transcriptional regulator
LYNFAYILLEKESWWNRRIAQSRAGKKVQAFVRKNTVGPTNATLLLFYVNHPVKEIKGVGEFEERVIGDVENLWNAYSEETVFESRDEYLTFMQGRSKATFIRFKNLRELQPPIPLEHLLQIIGVSRLPRSGKYLNRETLNKLNVSVP